MHNVTITEPSSENRPLNIGTSMNDGASRLDGRMKVTGAAKYGRDVYKPNSLFIAFVRCPFGRATLISCDEAAAKAVPGVLEVSVTTGKESQYHGQVVGQVVAESAAGMKRALRALGCKWKLGEGRVLTSIEQELGEPAALTPDTENLLKDGFGKHEAVYSTQVQTHCSLETHGVSIDHNGEKATVYASTQGTFSVRDGLDEAIGLPRNAYEVVCEFVGGGFGSKLNGAGKEGVAAAKIAAKYKRPAYLFVNRCEEHLDTGNRPSSRVKATISFAKDGTIAGGDIQTWGGVGPNRGGGGVAIPSKRYELGGVRTSHADVALNAGMPRAFRAPGHPQAAFAEELIIEEVAHQAGVDSLELRKRLMRSSEVREMCDLGARLIGWNQRAATGSATGVMRRGMGMGITSWGRIRSALSAEVVIHKDGSIEARTGTQDIGQGQRTAVGILTSETIGRPLESVSVSIGRSSLPAGPGSGGSCTLVNTAPAFIAASKDAVMKLLGVAAQRLNVEPSTLLLSGGQITSGGKVVLTWADACALLPDSIKGVGVNDQSTISADTTTGQSGGAQFVDIEVDTQTGVIVVHRVIAVQACGRIVSRKLAESQVIGGVIQGLSYALFENRILDRKTGAMVNPNLEWYKIAGTCDMPHIEPVLWAKDKETAGARALGEPPIIPTAGAIACALFNAIGVPIRHLPLTPDKVLAAVASREGAAS